MKKFKVITQALEDRPKIFFSTKGIYFPIWTYGYYGCAKVSIETIRQNLKNIFFPTKGIEFPIWTYGYYGCALVSNDTIRQNLILSKF